MQIRAKREKNSRGESYAVSMTGLTRGQVLALHRSLVRWGETSPIAHEMQTFLEIEPVVREVCGLDEVKP